MISNGILIIGFLTFIVIMYRKYKIDITMFLCGWRKINDFPKWVDYNRLNKYNKNIPGVIYTHGFKGNIFLYKYITCRGFENHGHGSDSWEKYYRKKRRK